MEVKRAMPHPALRNIVRSFEERRAMLGAQELSFPLTARPHQIIDIYLGIRCVFALTAAARGQHRRPS
jgi:hypothetical protein